MLRSPLQILNKVGLKKVQTTSWSVEGLYWDQWLTAAPPLIWEKKRWTLQVLLQYLGSEFILRVCVNWLHPGPAVLLSNCLQSARHDSRWPLISGFVVETCESSATALVCLTVFVLCVCVCVFHFFLSGCWRVIYTPGMFKRAVCHRYCFYYTLCQVLTAGYEAQRRVDAAAISIIEIIIMLTSFLSGGRAERRGWAVAVAAAAAASSLWMAAAQHCV